jgi:hypothetical protein
LDLSRRVGRADIWRREWELLENRVYKKPNGCSATGVLALGPDQQQQKQQQQQQPPAMNTLNLKDMEDTKLNWKDHIIKKRKQVHLRHKELYWLLGRTSHLSVDKKLLLYKYIITPIWNYGIEL